MKTPSASAFNASHVNKIDIRQTNLKTLNQRLERLSFSIDISELRGAVIDCFEHHLEDCENEDAYNFIQNACDDISNRKGFSISVDRTTDSISVSIPASTEKFADARQEQFCSVLNEQLRSNMKSELSVDGRLEINLNDITSNKIHSGHIYNNTLDMLDVSKANVENFVTKEFKVYLDPTQIRDSISERLENSGIEGSRADSIIQNALRVSGKAVPNAYWCDNVSSKIDGDLVCMTVKAEKSKVFDVNEINYIINDHMNDTLEALISDVINHPEDELRESKATDESLGIGKIHEAEKLLKKHIMPTYSGLTTDVINAYKGRSVVFNDNSYLTQLFGKPIFPDVQVSPLSDFGGEACLVKIKLADHVREQIDLLMNNIHNRLNRKEHRKESEKEKSSPEFSM